MLVCGVIWDIPIYNIYIIAYLSESICSIWYLRIARNVESSVAQDNTQGERVILGR